MRGLENLIWGRGGGGRFFLPSKGNTEHQLNWKLTWPKLKIVAYISIYIYIIYIYVYILYIFYIYIYIYICNHEITQGMQFTETSF